MLQKCLIDRNALFLGRLCKIDSAPRTFHLKAGLAIGRAGIETEPAVHALGQVLVRETLEAHPFVLALRNYEPWLTDIGFHVSFARSRWKHLLLNLTDKTAGIEYVAGIKGSLKAVHYAQSLWIGPPNVKSSLDRQRTPLQHETAAMFLAH